MSLLRICLVLAALSGLANELFAAPYTFQPRAVVLSGTAVQLTWEDSGSYPADYWQIYRDGMLYATATTTSYTDTALTPGENHTYYIASVSSQTYSVPSRSLIVTTKTPGNPFVLDGAVDFSSYTWLYPSGCDCTHLPSLPLYAAVRGNTLYVATASPGAPNSPTTDRFIIISDVLDASLTAPAPWAKVGTVASSAGKPFIAAESTNSYVGWFNAPASAQAVRSSGPNGIIEGTIDLIETFGYIPEKLYMVVLAYDTPDYGQLVWQGPNPQGALDNGVTTDEFLVLNTAGLRDNDADGILDLADPTKDLKLSITENPDGSITLSLPTVPWRTYVLERRYNLTTDQYSTVRAWFPQNGEFTASYLDMSPTYYSNWKSFYRLSVEEPN